VRSIEAVVRGEGVVHTSKAPRGEVGGGRRTDLLTEHLTKRERSVLALLVDGSSSEQIAHVLSISPNTVRTHIQNVLTKLQVHSRLEAAAFAVKRGLVETREPPRRRLGGRGEG
jgi:two-component system, NarL family, nitrate/nitrite response regulator NarL